MRLHQFLQRDSDEDLVAILEEYSIQKRDDLEKRQGIIGGILNGGVSLINGVLNPNRPTTTTQDPPRTQQQPPVTTTRQEQPTQAVRILVNISYRA